MKKIEMTYGDKEAALNGYKILYSGKFKGFNYFVYNVRGAWPCGYVEVTGTKYDECESFNKYKKKGRENYWRNSKRKIMHLADFDLSDSVHGGLTYSDGKLAGVYIHDNIMENVSRWFVGWDYCHLGDYEWRNGRRYSTGIKYTTDEVISDCKACIKAILKNNKKGE